MQASTSAGAATEAAVDSAVAQAEIDDLKSRLEQADRLVEASAEQIAELEDKTGEVGKLEVQLEAAKTKEARTINVLKSKLDIDIESRKNAIRFDIRIFRFDEAKTTKTWEHWQD